MATSTLPADTQTGTADAMASPATSSSTSSSSPPGWRHWPEQAWWPLVTRGFAAAFFAVVAGLIFRQARTVDWPAVLQALRDLPTTALAVGGALALLSHFTYGSFDWVGRHCSGHRLARTTTLAIAMTSYPFTLNLGSLIGGVGVRYRLYDRRGGDQHRDELGGLPVAGGRAGVDVAAACVGRVGCRVLAVAPGRHGVGIAATGLCGAVWPAQWPRPHAERPRVPAARLARGAVAGGRVGRQLDVDGRRAVDGAATPGELPRRAGHRVAGGGGRAGAARACGPGCAGGRRRGAAGLPGAGAGRSAGGPAGLSGAVLLWATGAGGHSLWCGRAALAPAVGQR